jgi:sugar phosphate isomerase/epimerase
MSKPIAVQLYSVREQLAADFVGTIKKIAEIGYAGVEPAGFPVPVEEAAKLFSDLGLKVCSTHSSFPDEVNQEQVLADHKILGCNTIISGFGKDGFADEAAIRKSAAIAQRAAEFAKTQGLRVGIHNHGHEFSSKVGGRYGYELFLELAPEVFSELDVFWTAHGGADPVDIVTRYQPRLPFLHLKDGPVAKGWPMTAVGKGDLDIPSIVNAADPKVLEWLVVELDACDTDMMEAVKDSFDYLAATGLGHGR